MSAFETRLKALTDIMRERDRQVVFKGYDAQHDDEHADGSLVTAACAYALGALPVEGQLTNDHIIEMLQALWPWERSTLRLSDARTDLIKASALLLAEIERLDRAEVSNG